MTQIKDITVQEIDDFITENSLSKKDKFMFRILRNSYINGEKANTHIEDKELHTPKGLLVRTKVIGWAIFIMFLVSTIVMYIPDGVAWLKALP